MRGDLDSQACSIDYESIKENMIPINVVFDTNEMFKDLSLSSWQQI